MRKPPSPSRIVIRARVAEPARASVQLKELPITTGT